MLTVKFYEPFNQLLFGQGRVETAKGLLGDDVVIWAEWYLVLDIMDQLS